MSRYSTGNIILGLIGTIFIVVIFVVGLTSIHKTVSTTPRSETYISLSEPSEDEMKGYDSYSIDKITVTDKRQSASASGVGVGMGGNGVSPVIVNGSVNTRFYIIYKSEDDKEHEVQVNEGIYEALSVGSEAYVVTRSWMPCLQDS